LFARDAALTIGIGGGNVSCGQEDQIAKFYDQAERIYTGNQGLWNHERHIVETFFPGPPARILDVGCGGGRTTGYLAERGYRVTGIDLSGRLIALAKKSFPAIDFRVQNASNLTFSDNSFDAAIFSHNGLDSVAPVALRLRVLNEILRVVRPGGRFYLSSHNVLGKLQPEGTFPYKHVEWAYAWIHRLLRQVFKLNCTVFSGYWWYHDVDGWQLLYSASPRVNLCLFREAGWRTVAVMTRDLQEQNESCSLWEITRAEHHVQYVLEKAADNVSGVV
jgi:ubiquinone/menaquinone biosynthesis C-methylase UbiE